MLILTRNTGETIRIGDDVEITIVEIRGGAARLSIKAPREVKVYREEVYQRIAAATLVAAQVSLDAAGALASYTGPTPAAAEALAG